MPPAYAQLNAPWEAALVGSTLDEVKNAAVRYEIDLRSLFIQYANGAEMMSAARFFEFAYDTKLTQVRIVLHFVSSSPSHSFPASNPKHTVVLPYTLSTPLF